MKPVPDAFERLRLSIDQNRIEPVEVVDSVFELEDSPEMLAFVMTELRTSLGYVGLTDSFSDIFSIITAYFYGSLEVGHYFSFLEFRITKLYSGISLLDFDAGLTFSSQTPEEKTLWKTFRVLDSRPEIGDGKMTVYSIKEGIAPPNEPTLYYIDRADAYKMNCSFEQYYLTVVDMLGIADWQYLYTDVSWNDPHKEDAYPKLKESLEALQKAFPDKAYQQYFELLESKWTVFPSS